MIRKLFIWLMIVLALPASLAAEAVPDSVCTGSTLFYRVDGEPGSSFVWTLIHPNGVRSVLPSNADTIRMEWHYEPGEYILEVLQFNDSFDCDAMPVTATVIIAAPPPLPVAQNFEVCYDGYAYQAGALLAPEYQLVWFADSTSTIPGEAPREHLPGIYQAWAGSRNNLGCYSDGRVPVLLTIHELPDPPMTVDRTVCYNGEVQRTSAIAAEGTRLTWFASESGPEPGAPPSGTLPGVYTSWVSSVDEETGCLSAERLPVSLTILAPPDPPLAVDVSACYSGEEVEAGAIVPDGFGIIWFSSQEGSDLLDAHKAIEPGRYIAWAATLDPSTACQSMERTPVEITIHSLPDAPIAQNHASCFDGNNHTAMALPASNAYLVWYDAASGGNPSGPPQGIMPGLYQSWAASVDSVYGCESSIRTLVELVVYGHLSPPLALDNTVCYDGNVHSAGAIAQEGAEVVWYRNETGDETAEYPRAYEPGTYQAWAASRIHTSGCESSERTLVTLTIIAPPPLPTVADAAFCYNGEPATFQVTAAQGTLLRWYQNQEDTLALTPAAVIDPGYYQFWVTSVSDSTHCENPTRIPVSLTIYELPARPMIESLTVCFDGQVHGIVYTPIDGYSLIWFSDENRLTPSASPSGSEAGIYTAWAFLQNDSTGCVGPGSEVRITILPAPEKPIVVDAIACFDGQIHLVEATTAPGTEIVWYVSSHGYEYADIPSGIQPGIYHAWAASKDTLTGCESIERVQASLTILQAPQAAVVQDLNVCYDGREHALMAEERPGIQILWFDSETSLLPMNGPPSAVQPGVMQAWALAIDSLTGCQSLSRTLASLRIFEALEPPLALNEIVCYTGESHSAGAQAPEGSVVVWFASEYGMEQASAPSGILPGTYVAWAASAIPGDGCESMERTMVTLTINDIPNLTHPESITVYLEDEAFELAVVSPSGGVYEGQGISNGWFHPFVAGEGSHLVLYQYTDENGCQASAWFTIHVRKAPEELRVQASTIRNLSCFNSMDGQASVVITGGIPPYVISWNDPQNQSGIIASGLEAGIYSVTVTDAANNLATGETEITRPEPLSATYSSENESYPGANDGSITITEASGGSGSYAYSIDGLSWQGATVFNQLPPGKYSIFIRDAASESCMHEAGTAWVEPAEPVVRLELIKTSDKAIADVGDTIGFIITVRNYGPSNASQAIVTDYLPDHLRFIESDNNGTFDASDNQVRWSLSGLAAGDSKTFRMQAVVMDDAPGGMELINRASALETGSGDIVYAEAVVTINSRSGIRVVKTPLNNGFSYLGQIISYEIAITNSGNIPLLNLKVTDPTAILEGSGEFDMLLPGSTISLLARHSITQTDLAAGKHENIARVSGTSSLYEPFNAESNMATTYATYNHIVANDDLMSEPINGHIGGIAIRNVLANDRINDNPIYTGQVILTLTQWSGHSGVNLNPANGQVSVAPGTPGGTYYMGYRICESLNPANCDVATIIVRVSNTADLAIHASTPTAEIGASQVFTYLIEVKNNGPDRAENAEAILSWHDSLSLESATPTHGFSTDNKWTIPSLASGEKAVLELKFKAPEDIQVPIDILFEAMVSSQSFDPYMENNKTSTRNTLVPSADLAISFIENPGTAIAGSMASLTARIVNKGASSARAVVANFSEDALVRIKDITCTEGFWNNGQWHIGLLEKDQEAFITLDLEISPGIENGTLWVMEAIASSSMHDPDPSNNTTQATIAIQASADLAISILAESDHAIAGLISVYRIEVSNLGVSAAYNVNTTLSLSEFAETPEYITSMGSWSGTQWRIDSIYPGETVYSFVRTSIPANIAEGNLIEAMAVVSALTPDPATENNKAVNAMTVSTQADLAASLHITPDPALAGEEISYSLAVTNLGPSMARNLITRLSPDQELQLASAMASEGSIDGNTWMTHGLMPGDTIQLMLQYLIPSSAVREPGLRFGAEVSSITPDPENANNQAWAITRLETRADLSLDMIALPDTVIAGQTITHLIKITNQGPSDAREIFLMNQGCSSILNTKYSKDGGLSWEKMDEPFKSNHLQATDSLMVMLRSDICPSALEKVSNTSSVWASTADPDSLNNSMQLISPVQTLADLIVAVQAAGIHAVSGDRLRVDVSLRNDGPSDARMIRLYAEIPNELILLGSDKDMSKQAQTIVWDKTVLSPSGSETFPLHFHVPASIPDSTLLRFVARAETITRDPDNLNNKDTLDILIVSEADLSISKTIINGPEHVMAGENLTYMLEVRNHGPSHAVQVTITDELPFGMRFLEATGNAYYCELSHTVSWDIPFMANGEVLQRLLTARIGREVRGDNTLVNNAFVWSRTTDPDIFNNKSEASVLVGVPIELFIPEAFSPNGDGINEQFVIGGLFEHYPNNSLVVMDRFGKVVFRASPYMNNWDGRCMDGKPLPVGTYYYILDLKDGNSLKRFVYIIR